MVPKVASPLMSLREPAAVILEEMFAMLRMNATAKATVLMLNLVTQNAAKVREIVIHQIFAMASMISAPSKYQRLGLNVAPM